MSKETNISWADSTASPWFGCTEVSPGCANCYARELTLKHGWAGWGDKAPRVRSKGFGKNVLAMNRKPWVCSGCNVCFAYSQMHKCPTVRDGYTFTSETSWRRRSIFPSLMDWLDPQVPIEWLADFLRLIYKTPNLDWLLLTKRPKLFKERLHAINLSQPEVGFDEPLVEMVSRWIDGTPPSNVWVGVTVEDQMRADERIPKLLAIPAKVRFLSAEPLLENVDLGLVGIVPKDISLRYRPVYEMLDWVIVGGESGPKRRDCGVEAIRNVAQQCVAARVPVWVKQDCASRPGKQGRIPNDIWNLKQLPA